MGDEYCADTGPQGKQPGVLLPSLGHGGPLSGVAPGVSRDLNGELLIAVWPELLLPKGLRRAWEERHPALRAARLAAA